MSVRTKKGTKQGFRCAECGKGNVWPVAAPGRLAKYRTLTLPVPADIEIPTCDDCGEEWINDGVARELDAALEEEFRARLRDLVIVSLARLAKSNISKASVERVLGLSQGYLSHLTAEGDKTPSAALALNLVHFARNPRSLRRSEELWKRLSGAKPDPAAALAR